MGGTLRPARGLVGVECVFTPVEVSLTCELHDGDLLKVEIWWLLGRGGDF